MEIFTGKAGVVAGHKFNLKIGGKDFSYSGEHEQGYFLEELAWNAIVKADIHRDAVYEVIVTTMTHKIYMSFQDNLSSGDGENTLSYSLDDITEEQIAELLSDQIIDPSSVIFMEWDGVELHILESDDYSEFVFSFEDLAPTPMVTGTLKRKLWLKKHKFNILGIFLIFSIPGATIPFIYSYLEKTHTAKIEALSIEKNKLISKKKKTIALIERANKDYLKMQHVVDVFDSKDGEKRLKRILFKKKRNLTKH